MTGAILRFPLKGNTPPEPKPREITPAAATGNVEAFMDGDRTRTCPMCGGSGWCPGSPCCDADDHACHRCNGTGGILEG